MEISEVIRNRPPGGLRPKDIFGAMNTGDAREVRGTPAERLRMRKSVHWVGQALGMVFRTRTEGEVLVVTRIA
ncbi:MAG: hypothetical protein KA265_11520 [Piscinibacter sp.]|nr:hypothetical protein [Piscinibacter sp.]MBP6636070.1 hypothetical protein [Sulfuritalea sp.]